MFWFQDEDGNWVIHARLPPEQGQLVVKTLEALTRPLVEERKDECKALQAARLRAAAKAIRRHPGESREPVPELHQVEEKISAETFGQFMNQARADAFGNLVEHFLAMAPDYRQLQGLTGAERCQVILHIDVNTLRQQRAGVCCAHGRAGAEGAGWLLPVPRVLGVEVRGRSSRNSLGGWRRDLAGEPGHLVPLSPHAVARGAL